MTAKCWASGIRSSPWRIHTSAGRSRLARWRSDRCLRGSPRCVCACGLLRRGKPLRGQKLGRTRSTACLGRGMGCGRGVAEPFGRSQRPCQREDKRVRPPARLPLRGSGGVPGSGPLAWPVPSRCPACNRHTSYTKILCSVSLTQIMRRWLATTAAPYEPVPWHLGPREMRSSEVAWIINVS